MPNSLNSTILAEDSLNFSNLNEHSLKENYEFFWERRSGNTLKYAFLLLESYIIVSKSREQQYINASFTLKCPWISQNIWISLSSVTTFTNYLAAYIIGCSALEGCNHLLLRSTPRKEHRWLPWITPSGLSIGII